MPTSTGTALPHTSLPVVPSLSDNYAIPVHLRRNSRPDLELGASQGCELSEITPAQPSSSKSPSRGASPVQQSNDRETSVSESERLLDPSDFESDPSPAAEDSSAGAPSHSRQMRKKAKPNGTIRTSSLDSDEAYHNGRATGSMEHRRKHAVLDSPTAASQTAHLMNRTSFTLDDSIPPMSPGSAPTSSRGFSELPKKDQRNFMLLVLLYFLQGVPMGLASGSVPFLLKKHVSYGSMGVFSLASYPYSLKLLWSPIVDAIWSPRVGRRKSWILPIQALSGIGMIWLAARVEGMMAEAGKDDGAGVWGFTWWWFSLVFMCATQDIAVDGWALTLLSTENLSYASTAQTVGLTAGQFISSTVFLAFNSEEFAHRWFGTPEGAGGLISLGGALAAAGWLYLIVTVGLAVLKREELTKNTDGVWDVYKIMGGILKLRNVQIFIIVHLIAKIGFQANDAATFLKLLDKGFTQDDLALVVLIDFPFEIGLGYYVGKWSQTYPPMHLWCWAFVGRLLAAVLAQLIVIFFPAGGVTTGYLITIICGHVFTTFMGTVMFVAVSAFHAKIADPVIGGTYMTLLATVSNLGGTFPRFFVLKFIDMFTVATCSPPATAPPEGKLKGPLITESFSCVLQAERDRCKDGGGACNVSRDGFYIVNILCVIIGVVTFWGYIKPAVMKLQSLPLKAWRLSEESAR